MAKFPLDVTLPQSHLNIMLDPVNQSQDGKKISVVCSKMENPAPFRTKDCLGGKVHAATSLLTNHISLKFATLRWWFCGSFTTGQKYEKHQTNKSKMFDIARVPMEFAKVYMTQPMFTSKYYIFRQKTRTHHHMLWGPMTSVSDIKLQNEEIPFLERCTSSKYSQILARRERTKRSHPLENSHQNASILAQKIASIFWGVWCIVQALCIKKLQQPRSSHEK